MVKSVWIRQLINGGNQFLFQIIWIYSFSKFTSSICIVVDAGLTTPNMDAPDHYQTTYDSKTKIVVFYYLIERCIDWEGAKWAAKQG